MEILTRGDNHVLAFSRAIGRSQQIVTGALLAEDDALYERLLRDASAISTEWEFTQDLRQAIYDMAVESVTP